MWRQPMPLNLAMEVFVNGRSLGVQTKTVNDVRAGKKNARTAIK